MYRKIELLRKLLKQRTHICVLCLSLSLAVFSCKPAHNEREALTTVVARYNAALVNVYKKFDFETISALTSDSEFRRINITVRSYRQDNIYMDAQLNTVKYGEISIDADKAKVATSEEWTYRWIQISTGAEVEPTKKIQYDMAYHLIKKDGRWIVDKTDILKENSTAAASI